MGTTIKTVREHATFRLPERNPPFVLRRVFQATVDGCRSDVLFDFGDGFLRVHVNENDDTLSASFLDPAAYADAEFEAGSRWSDFGEFREYIGRSCGLTWQAVNSQGYCDSILIAFGGIVPDVMLHALASSILLFRLQEVPAPIPDPNGTT
jgi:hypothetical protein